MAPEGGPGSAAAAAFASDASRGASDSELSRAWRVAELIWDEQRRGPDSGARRDLIAEGLEPNLVFNLATVIRESWLGEIVEEDDAGDSGLFWIPEVQGFERASEAFGGLGGISVNAIGATVAAVFSRVEVSPRLDAGRVIHGAALLALALSDVETAARIDEVGPGEIEFKAPWEVSHPVLLDPVMWMVLTAYRRT